VVSLQKGLASVKMKPGNTTTLKQLNQAITKNGFAMKQSTAVISGKIMTSNGKQMLQVSGTNEMLELTPESAAAFGVESFAGKSVIVTGEIPEPGKGKAPDSIHYHSITEDQIK